MNKRGYIAIAVIVLVAAAAVAYFGFLRPSAGDKSASLGKGKIIVALDAGHGGKDPGATSGDYNEKAVNLAVMKKVEALFATDPQIRTVTTRSVDVYVPLEERIRVAEAGGATVYVSMQGLRSKLDPRRHARRRGDRSDRRAQSRHPHAGVVLAANDDAGRDRRDGLHHEPGRACPPVRLAVPGQAGRRHCLGHSPIPRLAHREYADFDDADHH
ncbi:MAG: N-acetylmuramoyl-L-alanine amidase, partial [Candidatus Bipolaricaulota bacterium]|nr:N-acetylmuramoyl-L-alanine amidase [Candidatus Bipolaricaulota bacterium]